MMGCLVVGLKGAGSLGLGLPATIEARQHDPGGNGSRGRLAGGRRELESYRRSFSLDERRREEEKGYGMVKQMGMVRIDEGGAEPTDSSRRRWASSSSSP